jgi:hypothetical protein
MTDPLHRLQQAAAASARVIDPGSVAGSVIVLDTHGRKLIELAVPASSASPPPALGDEFATPFPVTREEPATPGWSFTPTGPKFDGQPIPIRGRQLDVLRLLIRAEGPLSYAALRAAWGGYPAEESTVRWTVNELRKTLRTAFPDWETDPISASGDGYLLMIR